MKRIFAMVFGGLAAAALFGGFVFAVLVVAHVSEPGAATIHGVTSRRLWATASAAVALIGAALGGLALARRRPALDAGE